MHSFPGRQSAGDTSVGLNFPPVRTPEQIKAEEREKAIVEMAETMHAATGFGVNRADCEALYDAGYRKQVAP